MNRDRDLGERLRALREDRATPYKVRELGRALDIDPSRISRLETGGTARGITADELARFAAFYGVSVDFIVRGEESGTTELMERIRAAETEGLDESGERTVMRVVEQQVAETRLRRTAVSPAQAELLALMDELGGAARIQQELRVLRREAGRPEDEPARG